MNELLKPESQAAWSASALIPIEGVEKVNVLVIMSDEHSHQVMGCAGHPVVQTPVLDRLAREGTMFANCYTPSPICTPGRASFFTGRYVNTLGTWDNATPYDGKVRGISQHLHAQGEKLTSFGKLDLHPDGVYEGLEATMSVPRAHAQLESCFRGEQVHMGLEKRFEQMDYREGECFDDKIRNLATEWLETKKGGSEPWVLYVGFMDPHFPFYARKERWEQYEWLVQDVPESAKGPFDELNEPLRQLRSHFRGDTVNEATVRKAHVGYYAMTTRLDENVGAIWDKLRELGMEEDTLIIYTSDHGEQLGHHGLWWKCCMYEESAHVPLIMKGPGVRKGAVVHEPVSLVDIFPTICEARNIAIPTDIPGKSLLPLARGEEDPSRADFAFSEYHAHGVPSGMYMIRWKQWKAVYYVGYAPQLFNLEEDPEEMKDLTPLAGESPLLQEVLSECETRLYSVCDPVEVSERALRFQRELRVKLGLKPDFSHPKVTAVPHPVYAHG